jgi:hypothetical protein
MYYAWSSYSISVRVTFKKLLTGFAIGASTNFQPLAYPISFLQPFISLATVLQIHVWHKSIFLGPPRTGFGPRWKIFFGPSSKVGPAKFFSQFYERD